MWLNSQCCCVITDLFKQFPLAIPNSPFSTHGDATSHPTHVWSMKESPPACLLTSDQHKVEGLQPLCMCSAQTDRISNSSRSSVMRLGTYDIKCRKMPKARSRAAFESQSHVQIDSAICRKDWLSGIEPSYRVQSHSCVRPRHFPCSGCSSRCD